MQHLQDLAGASCEGMRLMHSAFEFAKLAVAKHPLQTRTRNLRIRSPTPCPLGQGGCCSKPYTPAAPDVNLKRHAQLLVCRSAAKILRENKFNPISAENQWSSGRIHRGHRCDTGSIPSCYIFSLLGQHFLQILLRVMQRA